MILCRNSILGYSMIVSRNSIFVAASFCGIGAYLSRFSHFHIGVLSNIGISTFETDRNRLLLIN